MMWIALIAMFALAGASLYLYQRIPFMMELQNPAAREQAQATVTDVRTPTMKKNQRTSDLRTTVKFEFTVPLSDATIHGAYEQYYKEDAPIVGEKVAVVYLRNHPQHFVREAELPKLANELRWSRIGMMLFGIAAVVVPFMILGFGRR
ncbi:MAG: DUF3592 domain-containing protein [Alphaproteobacteria bacterium]|nr:DUF3592 domain-containing protein [Alphaproteobacteria bacterium]